MMDAPLNLDAIRTPLNTVCLIEASAGTGKTYTIGSLYLRLLLQTGETPFPQALSVEQILVVTFTEAATEELKGRIRERIHQAKQAFIAYKTEGEQALPEDDFLCALLQHIEDLDLAIQRLTIAEQTMDLAAIYTIHGFCRRMLMQYAFNSGVHFNLELVKEEDNLLQRLFNEFWRLHFYPLPLDAAHYIHKTLGSPQAVFHQLKSSLSYFDLAVEIDKPEVLKLSLSDFLTHYVLPKQKKIQQFKHTWLQYHDDIQALFLDELAKSYKKGEKKSLKRTTFKSHLVPKWLEKMQAWAQQPSQTELPDVLVKYFHQQALNDYADEGATPLSHSVFELADHLIADNSEGETDQKIVLYHYLRGVQQLLIQYKLDHPEKNFDDLLRLLKEALYADQGEELAQFIRLQYPFAMIDEFQDTDAQQYQIFSKIYVEQTATPTGFIMIGDPKQAIYKFRGADIFTYFQAAEQAQARFTLGTNWRSEQRLVSSVNALFDFQDPHPFLYDQIQFQPVLARPDQAQFYVNQQREPALRCYIGDIGESRGTRFNEDQKWTLAQICARSIQNWLEGAAQHQAVLRSEKKGDEPIRAERIAVLVRDGGEADLVKQALQQQGIASVYLSDRSNVFDCPEAGELLLILTACLNPFSERNILNAIGTRIWGLTSAEISHIKQDEQRWTNTVEDFVRYQRSWQLQGILAMLHQLFLEKHLAEHLLALVGGERKVTDLLHLAELLQEATRLNESPASLLRWFEKQIQGDDRQDGQQIRLESERQLVKIVTVHKSKGLEYDLVWLPFIANPPRESQSVIQTYYEAESQKILWDIQGKHQALIAQEQKAEEMRLFYVALTRAKYQLAFALPETFKPSWSALQYVLTEGKMEGAEVRSILGEFQQKAGAKVDMVIKSFDDLPTQPPRQPVLEDRTLEAAQFHGVIEQNWQVSSFTAISQLHEKSLQWQGHSIHSTYAESAVDFSPFLGHEQDDEQNAELDLLNIVPDVLEEYPAGYSPFDFPAGTRVGKVLHAYFETHALNQKVEMAEVEKLCQQLELDENWFEPLQHWLTQILSTPLLTETDLRLSDLAPENGLKELEFYLKLERVFDVDRFNHLLEQYGLLSEPLQLDILREGIQGMMRGFIDLVFRHDGKYYLLDYKSNKLGGSLQDYATEKLATTMQTQHYDWQYLFYTVALHRYLRERDPHYCYEQHFGGVIYPFLRGMQGKAGYGVYFTRPDVGLIQALEELF
ncbi:exodeoxyribonuclease V subunit beta [Pasteurella sp. PK-2025]|uniref:exodeoxyribonuclease V subunit beta n=1 Tax=Pasteurella sp. PK-2025 TaxID=3413133 RepID=UPI003C771E75